LFFFFAASSPPTTQPPPTTETLSKEQPILNEVNIDNIIKANNNNVIVNNHNNDTTYGQTSTYSVHLSDKGNLYNTNNIMVFHLNYFNNTNL